MYGGQVSFLQANYDDMTYGDWSRSDVAKFTFAINGNGYCGYCAFTDNNAYVYKAFSPGNNYEVFFDFKYSAIDTKFDLFRMSGSHASTSYSADVWLVTNGSLYVNGVNTNKIITQNVWHKMFINVTNKNVLRYSLDGSILSEPYTASYTIQGYAEYGSMYNSNGGTFWVDNYTIASNVGTHPVASFTISPGTSGNGLTNFIFSDTSLIGSQFWVSYLWDFGDGNYTYGSYLNVVNHTYINGGNYMVMLKVSNAIGYDLAFANITVSQIDFSGGTDVDLTKVAILTFIIFFLAITTFLGLKYWFFMVLSGIGFVFVAIMAVEPLEPSFALLMAGAGILLMLWGGYRYVS